MAESVLITDQQSNVECNSKYIYDANEGLYNCVCSLSPARVVAGSISNHNIYRPSFKTSVFTARFSCHGCRTMGCFWPLTHEWVLQKRIIIPSFIHLNVSDSILTLRPEFWCGSKSNCSSVIMIRERGCLLQLTAFPPPPPFARGISIGQLIKGVLKQLVSLPTPFSAFSPPSLSPQILSLGLSAATEVDTCFTQSLPSKTQGT